VSLGAVVRAFDTRPVVKEQVQSRRRVSNSASQRTARVSGYAKVMSDEFIKAEMALPPRLQRWTYYHDS